MVLVLDLLICFSVKLSMRYFFAIREILEFQSPSNRSLPLLLCLEPDYIPAFLYFRIFHNSVFLSLREKTFARMRALCAKWRQVTFARPKMVASVTSAERNKLLFSFVEFHSTQPKRS